jgi:CheY-like chemotaxis protein
MTTVRPAPDPSPVTSRAAARDAARVAIEAALADAERAVEEVVPASREALVDARRRLEVARRRHDALLERCARQLEQGRAALERSRVTALVAHRLEWSAGRLRRRLEAAGVEVLDCLDNGADVVGATAAEQPDLVVMHDRLLMIQGTEVVSWVRRVAPDCRVVAQSADGASALAAAGAGAVVPQREPLEVVAETGLALLDDPQAASGS